MFVFEIEIIYNNLDMELRFKRLKWITGETGKNIAEKLLEDPDIRRVRITLVGVDALIGKPTTFYIKRGKYVGSSRVVAERR